MQTSAPPLLTDSPLPCSAFSKLEVAARLIKNGNAAMSREDKAAFGIDTWNVGCDTPEELNTRVAGFLESLSKRFSEECAHLGFSQYPPPNQHTSQQADELG